MVSNAEVFHLFYLNSKPFLNGYKNIIARKKYRKGMPTFLKA